MSESVAYPVRVLQEHITGLEAAITVCLADPDTRPVHKLRTETRRVEALLLLLAQMPGLPEHRKEAAALLRNLSRLRRAAGDVRDLDVHRKMLEALAEAETAVDQGKKFSRSRSEAVAEQAPKAEAPMLSRAAEELRSRMGKERDKAAAALQEVLRTRQKKAARAAEALTELLRPVEELPLPAAQLLQDAEAVLTRDGLLREDVAGLSRVELHSVRKAAKAARYLAESLPEDAAVAEAARQFEALQEAGGQWHDAWQLARSARRRFGKGHELTGLYREERDRKLAAYREALQARATKVSGKKKSEASKAGADQAAADPAPDEAVLA